MLAHLDTSAIIALGFLGAILVMSAGLFGWMMTRRNKTKT